MQYFHLLLFSLFAIPIFASTFVVNYGCLQANGSPVCAEKGNLGVESDSMDINACISDTSKDINTTMAFCNLTATMLLLHDIVYYGRDNCLYNSKSIPINDTNGVHQCASKLTSGIRIANPYYYLYGPDASR
ncbi:hypothetical protein B7494_g1744 [Chlorociboria aeruginascens]|nr:hypothetical protein B7494_g1744 [Chlorociboria aeruginascens]